MPAFTECAHTAYLIDRDRALPVGAGDSNRLVLGLRNANRTSIQWIVHQAVVGASATIDLYVADSDRADDIANTDPATNPYWSPLEDDTGAPVTFPHLPGAVAGSCLLALPLRDSTVTALLAVITVADAPYPLGSVSLLARTTG